MNIMMSNSGEQQTAKENVARAITSLRFNPHIDAQELRGPLCQHDLDVDRYNGVRVKLGKELEKSTSGRSDIVQSLEALLSLGSSVLVGLVKARDNQGNVYRYLSLYSGSPSTQRAQFIIPVCDGEVIVLGRGMIEESNGGGEYNTVSREHATIRVDNGILTVVDRDSTNGTTVFTPLEDDAVQQPFYSGDVTSWAAASTKVGESMQGAVGVRQQLGRFTVDI